MSKQVLTILGATGSIGLNTLDVVARHPERFEIFALTAFSRVDELAALCRIHRPQVAVVATAEDAGRLRAALEGLTTEVQWGEEALEQVACADEVSTVMAAIVGAAGMRPALAAARAGKRLMLANKEALVMAGELFMRAAHEGGATLMPIDSEHNAIFQSLPAGFDYGLHRCGVARIVLTASGGPFRRTPLAELTDVTPERACAHPNWVMGRKISVDSATMMNKGLEVIEARWLFGVTVERIGVLIHPESVIHSMVEYLDGSVIAQLGNPDMRTPIAHALAYPERIAAGVSRLNLAQIGKLSFEEPDLQRFPCLELAFEALRQGGCAPAVLNAANEVAVAAFLDGRTRFVDIARTVRQVLDEMPATPVDSLEHLIVVDRQARELAARALVSVSA